MSSHNLPFAACPTSEQDSLLKRWSGQGGTQSRRAMELLVQLCLEGFLGDPRHGGNRDRLGWSHLGLDGELAPDACSPTPSEGQS